VAAGEGLPLSALAERCACVRSNITQLGELRTDRAPEEEEQALLAPLNPQQREDLLSSLWALKKAL
jgi:hypothetical protein